jgi:hypothetical protein
MYLTDRNLLFLYFYFNLKVNFQVLGLCVLLLEYVGIQFLRLFIENIYNFLFRLLFLKKKQKIQQLIIFYTLLKNNRF